MHGEIYIVETNDSLTEEGANTQKNKFIAPESICVSCIATVGLVSMTSSISQTNQQINSIVFTNEYNSETLDFSNPEAVKALNKAILLSDYGITNWDIPQDYLCPPIPGIS